MIPYIKHYYIGCDQRMKDTYKNGSLFLAKTHDTRDEHILTVFVVDSVAYLVSIYTGSVLSTTNIKKSSDIYSIGFRVIQKLFAIQYGYCDSQDIELAYYTVDFDTVRQDLGKLEWKTGMFFYNSVTKSLYLCIVLDMGKEIVLVNMRNGLDIIRLQSGNYIAGNHEWDIVSYLALHYQYDNTETAIQKLV
jgi:hypothetical protein